MIYQRGHLARPLDAILSSASRLAVLRQLARGEQGGNGRLIARHAGLNHQTVALALEHLEREGIVLRTDWGRETRWRLNRSRWVVKELLEPLLAKEREHARLIADRLAGALKSAGAKGVLLHGDAAKGKLLSGKPLKAAVVGGGRKASEALRAVAAGLRADYGVELEGRVVSDSEALRLAAFEDTWRLLPDEGVGWVTLH